MKKLIYICIFISFVFFIISGCASSSHRSDVGVLKTGTRMDIGQYKGDD